MIVTESFVMINYPKTGSAFARKMIKQAYFDRHHSVFRKIAYRMGSATRPYLKILEFPNIRDSSERYGKPDEHGLFCQIPEIHKSKKVISIRRNIYESNRCRSGRFWHEAPRRH